ncbi:MAG: nitroreductase family protein [Candidatus Dormibacteraceae bacterium]
MSTARTGSSAGEIVLDTIRSRRVTRSFTKAPVSDEDVRLLLEAARWAPSSGNRYINKLLVVRDSSTIRLVKAFCPGILGTPTLMVAICTDAHKAAAEQVQLDRDRSVWIDVGMIAMNVMIAAHALGLGSCPATSFSRSAVSAGFELPEWLTPDFIVQIGHPAAEARATRSGVRSRLSVDELTYWERYEDRAPVKTIDPPDATITS